MSLPPSAGVDANQPLQGDLSAFLIDPTPLRFLEMFKSSYCADLSLNQRLALTPPELLKARLHLDATVTDALRKQKAPIVPV